MSHEVHQDAVSFVRAASISTSRPSDMFRLQLRGIYNDVRIITPRMYGFRRRTASINDVGDPHGLWAASHLLKAIAHGQEHTATFEIRSGGYMLVRATREI
jgi:hypothetical protein